LIKVINDLPTISAILTKYLFARLYSTEVFLLNGLSQRIFINHLPIILKTRVRLTLRDFIFQAE